MTSNIRGLRSRVVGFFSDARDHFLLFNSSRAAEFSAGLSEIETLITNDDCFTSYDSLDMVRDALVIYLEALDDYPFKRRQLKTLIDEINSVE
jgi:hypothetical protein